jgi:hypothetical protein
MAPFLEMFESLRWTLVGMYLRITDGICLLLVFHVHIHRPLPMNGVEAVRRAPCIFCPVWILNIEKCKRVCLSLCNPCLVGLVCSNLVVESWDEILFKGGRLWCPRFSAEFINPNDTVKRVDFGHTTVNLGHHLENTTNNPWWLTLVNLWSRLVKP